MAKIAFIFPGQGAQAVGMAKDLYEAYPEAQQVIQTFCDETTPSLKTIMFEGPEADLKSTAITQPAILAHSMAALKIFQAETGIKPDVTAGHSLGEYGALHAAGAITVETAAKLIAKRANLMADAPAGTMAAVLGLPTETVDQIIGELKGSVPGVLTVANYNSEGQVVISGSADAIVAAEPKLKEVGAKRVVPLPVGGAFHSPLMEPAAQAFAQFIADIPFEAATIPVIPNVLATPVQDSDQLKELLATQIHSSVRWTQTMDTLVNTLGVDTVIEFGPGKVLTGLMKRPYPGVTLKNIATVEDLKATIEWAKTDLAPSLAGSR